MPVELQHFVRTDTFLEPSYSIAKEIALKLEIHLNDVSVQSRLAEENIPGNPSSRIQILFLDYAKEIGFVDESRGLFANYEVSGLRPDYFLPIPNSGVLLEVERGKTTIKNMDLLDFWKCHLCEKANYLILLVPKELRQNGKMSPRRELAAVKKRLSTFFVQRNYTNVWALWLFGY